MKKISCYSPCRAYFGEESLKYLAEEIRIYGKKVLLTYGKGSIKKNGIFTEVTKILEENEISYVEYQGITTNPSLDIVEKGIQVAIANNVNAILAVGGGSVIDCSKAIAAGVKSEKNVWELVEKNELVEDALPVVSILTVAGAGSEMDGICSLVNKEERKKRGITSEKIIPKAAFLNPAYTSTVKKEDLAIGLVDSFSHLLEQYLQTTILIPAQTDVIETLMESLIQCAYKIVEDRITQEVRTNIMYISSIAMNGFLYKNQGEDWSLHPIEHQLSANYDIIHGIGIAVLLPHWLEAVSGEESNDIFYRLGVKVFRVNPKLGKQDVRREVIKRIRDLLEALEMPKTLRQIGITESELFSEMSQKATRSNIHTNYLALSASQINRIYLNAM